MSQLLDCFSEAQIVAVLRKVRAALPPGGRLWILELFWDRQRFEAAAFSLQQTSLYFSCVANGNSQMYDSKVFLALLPRAGLAVTPAERRRRQASTPWSSAALPSRGASRDRQRRRHRGAGPARPWRPGALVGGRLDRHPRIQRGADDPRRWPKPRWRSARGSSWSTTARPTPRRSGCDGLPLTLLRHAVQPGQGGEPAHRVRHALATTRPASITLDGDGQHDPGDAPQLLAVWRRRPDHLVIGSRLHDRSQLSAEPLLRQPFACFWISWAAGHPIADSQSGFRVYPRAVMAIALERRRASSRFTFESEILIEAARRRATDARRRRSPAAIRTTRGRSHYRAVSSTRAKIVAMVAGRLLRRGMYPAGVVAQPATTSGAGGTGRRGARPARLIRGPHASRSRCALAVGMRAAR